jgi:hypothetical protein
MVYIILLLTSIGFILSYKQSCTNCKWFILPNNVLNTDIGLCSRFKETYYDKGVEKVMYNFATHCRSNENLCGKDALLYEENNEIKQLNIEQDDLNNRCCGEVNETDEIEQLERDFFEIFQRIKKHNKKRIYNTSKKIYKLFKKND